MAVLNKMITLREASKISGYHSDYLSFLIRSRKLRGEKAGRSWLVSEREIQRLLDEKKGKVSVVRKTMSLAGYVFLILVGVGALLSFSNIRLSGDVKSNAAASDLSTEKYIIVETKLPR